MGRHPEVDERRGARGSRPAARQAAAARRRARSVGEFSFVGLGVAAGAITNGVFSAVLAAAVLSIALSAIAVRLFPKGTG
ncbi:MAG: hypothetical protein M3O64_00465 [Chloroflexota bacterium]|nr:hypothetical protein [Chloroflexota bacterium]